MKLSDKPKHYAPRPKRGSCFWSNKNAPNSAVVSNARVVAEQMSIRRRIIRVPTNQEILSTNKSRSAAGRKAVALVGSAARALFSRNGGNR